MLDRQPVPGGLIRFGVAPDHPSTKKIGDSFAGLFQHPRLRMHLNVEVGRTSLTPISPHTTTPSSTRSALQPTRRWASPVRT